MSETRRGPGLDSPDLGHTSRHDDDQDDGTSAWWAAPPHLIRPEDLDRVARAVDRMAGVLEVVALEAAAT
jgi:hypothetical protein